MSVEHPPTTDHRAEASRTLRDTVFPEIDYPSHPYYRELPELSGQPVQDARDDFLKHFRRLLHTEMDLAKYVEGHRPTLEREEPAPEVADMTAQLARDGILALRMSAADRAAMVEATREAVDSIDVQRRERTPERRGVGGVQSSVTHMKQPDERYAFFCDLLTRTGVLAASEQYYGVPFKLYEVTAQVNEGDDQGILKSCRFPDGRHSPLYYLHIDSTVGVMKVIIYRSEQVKPETGAFRYFPGTHCLLGPVERCIRKANDKAGHDSVKTDASRAKFMALPPEFRYKANFGNDLIDDSERTDRIRELERVFDSSQGDLLLFNNSGVHRGAKFEEPGRREMVTLRLVPDLPG